MNKRKIVLFLLLFVLLFSTAAFATTHWHEGFVPPEAGIPYAERAPDKEFVQRAPWSERLAASLLVAIPNYFIEVLGLYDPLELIFQTEIDKGENDKVNKLITPEIAKTESGAGGELEFVGENIVNLIRSIAIVVCVIVVIWAGLVFGASAGDPKKVTLGRNMLIGVVLCIFIVFTAEIITGTSLGIVGHSSDPTPATKTEITNTYFHTFTAAEFGALETYYSKLNDVVPISAVIVVVILGLAVLWSSANPGSKLGFKEYAIGFFLGMLMLKFGITLLSVIFDINFAVVKYFESIVGDNLSSSFLETFFMHETTLGGALLAFVAIFSIGILNFQYTMRKIVIALLIGLLPVVAIISIMPSNRNALETWFKEFISQTFLQSAHAAVLAFTLLLVATEGASFWLKLICIMGLPSIAIIVRRIFGAESYGSGMSAGVGAMIGAGSVMAISKMFAGNRGTKTSPPEEGSGFGTPAGSGIIGGLRKAVGYGIKSTAMLGGATVGSMISGAATGQSSTGVGIGAVLGAGAATATSGAIKRGYNELSLSKGDRSDMRELNELNQELNKFKSTYDGAEARYTASRNMYGDNSSHMESLMKHKDSVDTSYNSAEQEYLGKLQDYNNYRASGDFEAVRNIRPQVVETAKMHRAAMSERDKTHEQVESGKRELQESKANWERVQAERAKLVQKQALYQEKVAQRKDLAEKLKESIRPKEKGDINTTWR